MTLLQEIIQSAVNGSNADVSNLLRKCKILAVKLGNEEFKRWVDNELTGYKNREDLPQYRILTVGSYGYFAGFFGSGVNNMPISPSCLPAEVREFITHSYLIDPISSYVSLIETEKDNNAQEPWPPDITARYGDQMMSNMNCLKAWKLIPRNSLVGLVDTIKTKTLNFALEIEAVAPDAGEASINSETIPKEKVTQIFNTYITGNVQNVATGSSNFTQKGQFTIVQGDFESLSSFLKSKGVQQEDVDSLKDAVDNDAKDKSRQGIGDKVSSWMDRMLRKAGTATWNISLHTASILLANAIQQYYGIKPNYIPYPLSVTSPAEIVSKLPSGRRSSRFPSASTSSATPSRTTSPLRTVTFLPIVPSRLRHSFSIGSP
jgi:hypothetical protein